MLPSVCSVAGLVDAPKGPVSKCFVQYQCCDWWDFAVREWKCQEPAIEPCNFGSGPPECAPPPYEAACGSSINACVDEAVGLTSPQTVSVPVMCDSSNPSTLKKISACFQKLQCCSSWDTATAFWQNALSGTSCNFGPQCTNGKSIKASMSANMAISKVCDQCLIAHVLRQSCCHVPCQRENLSKAVMISPVLPQAKFTPVKQDSFEAGVANAAGIAKDKVFHESESPGINLPKLRIIDKDLLHVYRSTSPRCLIFPKSAVAFLPQVRGGGAVFFFRFLCILAMCTDALRGM